MKRTLQHLFGCAALLSAATTGCSTGPSDRADGFIGNPIINGTTADAPHHESVVSLHYNGSENIFCSGTLVSPRVVVTAGHCLDVGDGSTFETMDPSLLTVYFGDDPTSSDEPYASNHVRAAETAIYPGYDPSALLNDIAFVRLAEDAPAKAVTAPYLGQNGGAGFADPEDIGAVLNFVGYGYSEVIQRGPFNTKKSGINTKLQIDDTLDAFGCQVAGCPSGGGDPDVVATQISYSQNSTDDGGPCNGDSGGPAFIQQDTVWTLAGVTSYGDSQCSTYGASTRVDAFASAIDAFVASEAPEPPSCTVTESPEASCDDGIDNDCDGVTDSADDDCTVVEPPGTCDLAPVGASCSSDSDCCSGKCRGKPGDKSCK